MEIRKATEEEMSEVWRLGKVDSNEATERFFREQIGSGNADFWTIDDNGILLGELYVFHKLADEEFADGKEKVYLCAFRVRKDRRGQGLGTMLMKRVLRELKDSGFRTATIGVDETEEANIRLYEHLGFTEKIKDCYEDPCAMDDEMRQERCSCFWLLQKRL